MGTHSAEPTRQQSSEPHDAEEQEDIDPLDAEFVSHVDVNRTLQDLRLHMERLPGSVGPPRNNRWHARGPAKACAAPKSLGCPNREQQQECRRWRCVASQTGTVAGAPCDRWELPQHQQECQPLSAVIAGFAPPEPCALSWASVLLAEAQTELAALAEAARCAAARNYQTAPLARALHAEVVWELEQVKAAQAKGFAGVDNDLLRRVSELRAGAMSALEMLQDAFKCSNSTATDATATWASNRRNGRHCKPETPPRRSRVTPISALCRPLFVPSGEAAADFANGGHVLGQKTLPVPSPLGRSPSCPSQPSSLSPTSPVAAALGDVAVNMRRVLDEIHLTRQGFAQKSSERRGLGGFKDLRKVLFSSRERLKTCRGLLDRHRAMSDGRSPRRHVRSSC